ncbi:ATP-binding protein [Streptomyces sp. MJM1172]|uniref:ATP-binding protein n=1 Tax=Streptomyces sp. MJM1172 TaxID=1703926 RepID=UPI0009A167AE|nr:ATP-binding protein [Streptomyces sp. MJM1172]
MKEHERQAMTLSPADSAALKPRSRTYSLPGGTTAPTLARQHVRAYLGAWRIPAAAVDDAATIASELTTNAVRHTESPFVEVEIGLFPGGVRIAVHDSGPRPDTPLTEIAELAEGGLSERGRGLGIVRALATCWGAEPTNGTGLRVWAAIDQEARS